MNGETGRPRRRLRLGALSVALTATLALLCCTGGTAAFFLTELGGDSAEQMTQMSVECTGDFEVNVTGRMPRLSQYGDGQLRNAARIIKVGQDMKVPPRGWVVAVATAMQESGLRNLANRTVAQSGDLPNEGVGADHDSVGLFQQRASWGSVAQRMNPEYAARKFYEKLLTVQEWERLPLTVAAQKVQVSAFPDAYAKHETLAAQIVDALAGGAARTALVAGRQTCDAASGQEIAASGWTAPIAGGVGSGFRTASRPGHNGVDIGAGKGTPIHAAASGRVLVSRCDPDNGGGLSCDVDGYPGKGGCGWFVDILHAGDLITRYCHMVEKPRVSVGQHVDAGEVIGEVGSSGNSSGPHLHFEVHENGDRSSAGAIDPVPFMRTRGAPLRRTG
ncbi:M23 family metallopeptidase [Micromonospora krabiensis]|uniref:Murein DD-endopeptidase MepM and murein hydrolase activator NlpD, contain LysM domain n=1 Tax=Micromonospora krabiensis TaxID=307121 RepID=A0A1C3N9G6_9ACTN|nr:M23 family metallopeptidase [Micromonospora krabiensis]SBV29186.1 Murein DD-endopeptidase MepM and murein hydrolase activator NlpD, contain LysM domain [Micromonospora krabiensis]